MASRIEADGLVTVSLRRSIRSFTGMKPHSLGPMLNRLPTKQ